VAAIYRLYYTDSYLTEFDAQVAEISADGKRVYLDVTAFYPTSGGQPHDLGTLEGTPLKEVIDDGERIAHVIEGPIQADQVHCRIDWPRRYDHMQQHTGQHLLSAVLAELFGFRTLSFHLGPEVSTIELGTPDLSDAQIEQAEESANRLVWQAKPVSIQFEDAEAVQGLRKASGRTGTLRIVDIEGVDRSACGGTHVRSTAELGLIQLRRTEKIRGNIRLEFVCGARALRRARQDYRILMELSRQTAVAIDGLPEHVSSVRQRLMESEKDRQKAVIELARLEANALYDAAVPDAEGMRRIVIHSATLNEEARIKAQTFAGRPKASALIVGAEPPAVILAASKDSGIDAGAILKKAFLAVGGRGGGSAVLAQGSLPNAEAWESVAKAAGFSSVK
jgi:alanyl-tRNA synthetase